MSECKCRTRRPDGIWSISDLKGAKIKIVSWPAMQLSGNFDFSRTYTLDDITYRVSLDGKAVSLVKLKELPDGPILTLKDIEIVSVKGNNN